MDWEIITETTRGLPVSLTDEEMAERGYQLGKLEREIREREENRRSVMRDLKAQIDADRGRAVELAETLESRTEDRAVPVRIEGSFSGNVVRVVRVDTGEVVEERAMSADERAKLTQSEIPLGTKRRAAGHLSVIDADPELPPEPE